MKKIIILIAVLMGICFASSFCEGFKKGYKEGYCYKKFSCIEPFAPLCPLPNIGEDDWLDGYQKGFLLGLSRQ